jgi:hypothetical protein
MKKYEKRMTIDEERKYLHKMRIRYWQAKRKSERSQLLDEMQEVTGKHRKSLIRLINGDLARKKRSRERGKTYGIQIQDAVKIIARSMDYPCAERLQPNLQWMAEHLAQHGEITINAEILKKLGRISISTVRRIVGPVTRIPERISAVRKPSRRKQKAKETIPTKRIAWNEAEVGHFETDTVHHCGMSAAGLYVHTLQMSDVATGWGETVATLGRSYRVMEDAFGRIQARTPLPILEIHPDNGSEFLNAFLLKFWKDQYKGAEVSRSRPYQKNDNRFVEEDNGSFVRAYIGYARLDTVQQTILLNRIYEKLNFYHNFFLPVMRQKEKSYPKDHSMPPKRKHDRARTPFERLCERKQLPVEKIDELLKLRETTNPIRLRKEIEEMLQKLFELPAAREGQTENIFDTLGLWRH